MKIRFLVSQKKNHENCTHQLYVYKINYVYLRSNLQKSIHTQQRKMMVQKENSKVSDFSFSGSKLENSK